MTIERNATTSDQTTAVRSIVPCLTFDGRAEEAMSFYVSVFKDSRIVSVVRSESDGPVPKGKVLHGVFELGGRQYTTLDGGPSFRFSQGFSLVATCETQAELDEVWRRLSEGGEEGQCGWLTDRFGLSWQIVPAALGEMMGNPTSGNPGKVMGALLRMGKIDIATLETAYKQP